MFKDIIAQRVVDYYSENVPIRSQIAHTASVANYARLIAKAMGLNKHEIDLHEASAWLHDIGCPDAIRKYGNSIPEHQHKEGERIVNEWLNEKNSTYPEWNLVINELTIEEKHWLAQVVGSHHQQKAAIKSHFEPLFESDLIVNILEGYYGRNMANHYYDTLTITEAGKALFKKMIFEKP